MCVDIFVFVCISGAKLIVVDYVIVLQWNSIPHVVKQLFWFYIVLYYSILVFILYCYRILNSAKFFFYFTPQNSVTKKTHMENKTVERLMVDQTISHRITQTIGENKINVIIIRANIKNNTELNIKLYFDSILCIDFFIFRSQNRNWCWRARYRLNMKAVRIVCIGSGIQCLLYY